MLTIIANQLLEAPILIVRDQVDVEPIWFLLYPSSYVFPYPRSHFSVDRFRVAQSIAKDDPEVYFVRFASLIEPLASVLRAVCYSDECVQEAQVDRAEESKVEYQPHCETATQVNKQEFLFDVILVFVFVQV